jgi:hypothetical protein
MLTIVKQARYALIAIALPVAFLSPSPAMAQYCPPGSAMEFTQNLILTEDGSIEATLGSIIGAIAFWLPQIEMAITAAGGSATQASNVHLHGAASINDVGDNHHFQLRKSVAQGVSADEAQPSVTLGQPDTGVRRIAAADLVGIKPLVNNALTAELGIAENTDPLTQYGTFVEVTKQFQNSRIPNYAKCDELVNSNGSGSCTNGPLPNGDVNANSVFGYDTYDSGSQQIVNNANNGTTAQIQQAALDYCRSLIADISPDPNTNSALSSPQGAVNYITRKSSDARMSLAQKVCYEISIERQPMQSTVSGSSFPNDTLNWGIKTLQDLNYPNIPQTLSPYQLMNILYNLQFSDPNWTQLLSSDNELQQMRTAVELHALRLRLQWENQQSLDEIKLLKAAEVSLKVEGSRHNASPTALPAQ